MNENQNFETKKKSGDIRDSKIFFYLRLENCDNVDSIRRFNVTQSKIRIRSLSIHMVLGSERIFFPSQIFSDFFFYVHTK